MALLAFAGRSYILTPLTVDDGAIELFLDNLDPSLEHAWHPVALSRELRPGGWLQVRLLGRNWTLRRDGADLTADPPAFGVRDVLGLVWLAPAEPADVRLELPRT